MAKGWGGKVFGQHSMFSCCWPRRDETKSIHRCCLFYPINRKLSGKWSSFYLLVRIHCCYYWMIFVWPCLLSAASHQCVSSSDITYWALQLELVSILPTKWCYALAGGLTLHHFILALEYRPPYPGHVLFVRQICPLLCEWIRQVPSMHLS